MTISPLLTVVLAVPAPTAGRLLRPGGQLAVQVPANFDHPSHIVAAEVAQERPFLDNMLEAPPGVVNEVLKPERYAELLHELGNFQHFASIFLVGLQHGDFLT